MCVVSFLHFGDVFSVVLPNSVRIGRVERLSLDVEEDLAQGRALHHPMPVRTNSIAVGRSALDMIHSESLGDRGLIKQNIPSIQSCRRLFSGFGRGFPRSRSGCTAFDWVSGEIQIQFMLTILNSWSH